MADCPWPVADELGARRSTAGAGSHPYSTSIRLLSASTRHFAVMLPRCVLPCNVRTHDSDSIVPARMKSTQKIQHVSGFLRSQNRHKIQAESGSGHRVGAVNQRRRLAPSQLSAAAFANTMSARAVLHSRLPGARLTAHEYIRGSLRHRELSRLHFNNLSYF